jgi:hypothetical protein
MATLTSVVSHTTLELLTASTYDSNRWLKGSASQSNIQKSIKVMTSDIPADDVVVNV